MTLIAVAPTKYSKGIGREGSRADYAQVELVDALKATYASDAHVVGFVDTSRSDLRQHRWRKEDIQHPLVDPSLLAFTCVFIDVDNPNHAAWTPETMVTAIESFEKLPILCGVYLTAHGYRLVQPLKTPVPVLRAERIIRELLSILDAAGFAVDWAAKDWTRHFRAPNVRRNGKPYRSPFVDFSRMAAIDVAVPIVEDVVDIPSPRQKRKRKEPQAWTTTLAEHWQRRARVVGDAIRTNVSENWHHLYLAIGGALLTRGTPPEHVPELVRLIASHAGSEKPEHHAKSARDTVTRYLASKSITSFRELYQRAPMVAEAVDDALDDAVERPAFVPAPHLAETTEALHAAIRNAGDGLTVIRAECGLGKTRAAQNIAAERARKFHLTVVDSQRAPAQSKTAISVDKNELAQQVAQDLFAQGIPVRRVFGPLSVKNADDSLVCLFADRAKPLVEGGQSLQWEFCLGRGKSKCEHYATCTAKDGEEVLSPDHNLKPRVTVGTHALLGELDASAGATGLLVIDEPPALLETLTITPDDIDVALRRVHDFERGFAQEMSQLLLIARDWEDATISWTELTASLSVDIDETKRPPLRASSSALARSHLPSAREIGTASKVMLALVRSLRNELVNVRLEDEPRRIIVTSTRKDLTEALRREGSVVAMDANADLHMPAFAKVVGYEPVLHSFAASDGAPVERTLLRSSSSTRRSWLAHGRLVLDTGLAAALREVVSWANETRIEEIRPLRLGIITMEVVELAIAGALRPNDSAIDAKWKEKKQPAATLAEARALFTPIFSEFKGDISLAHYGATRGLNRMSDVDCLATIGDPWPSLGGIQNESEYLGVDSEERMRMLCAAELEQAHGRLRAVHRKRAARALHVGNVTPGGSAWATNRVIRRRMLGGRPKSAGAMSKDEFRGLVERLGGQRPAARLIGCSVSTIARYLDNRAIPPAVAAVMRRSIAELPSTAIGVSGTPPTQVRANAPVPETPLRESVFNRGFGNTPNPDSAAGGADAAE